jgi:N-acetyl-alpha-D-glucosaminyl L-malate synthase BshA
VRVIHNFVDCDRFRPRADAALRARFAPHGEPLLLHASNFRPVKNVGFLLEVFAGVAARTTARLLLVGEGPELILAQQRAVDLGLHDRVQFLGNQEGIERLLALADVFLLPSHHESFGLAALEAMAAGVVVVATSVGGTPEVIEDGTSGFLRHPADLSGWVQTVVDLLAYGERRRRIQALARQAAVDRFCRDRVVEEYEEEYRRAVETVGRRVDTQPGRP